ncbi:BRCA2, helical [Musa troglodytarum]|uniref:BRCA2, helical n=1 Tax=Musa troglodytarum TaxID=320322 RepID=A0A9E7KLF8_9LILI|nr:BRCA2, helical [Musa troglodytarum]
MNREIAGTSLLDCVDVNSVQRSPENCIDKFCSTGSHLTNGQLQKTLEHKLDSSDYGQSPVKFQTAGGRFITPLKGSTSLLATGSSKPSTTESSCCGRISTRYPFQLKRKNLKDFFGGPPTCQDLMVKCCITQSGSLPHEVSHMDADNAVTYRFYDASHHDEIGLEAFQVMLLKSGASSSNATKEVYDIIRIPYGMIWDYLHAEAMSDELDPADGIFHHPASSSVLLWILADRKLGKFRPKTPAKPVKDADMCFSLDFPNGHLKTTGPVDSFRPKANSQNDDKELGVEESFCASTLCSGCNQTQATHSEINAAQQLIQAEQSILLNTSGDKEWVQSGDIDVLPNTAESKEQASCLSMSEMHQQSFPAWTLFTTYLILVEPLAIVEDANLATPSSGSNILSSELNATHQPLLIAKEFAALKSTDDRLQVSFSDGDLRAFPDNQREVEMAMLSGLESLDEFSFHHNSTTDKCQTSRQVPT